MKKSLLMFWFLMVLVYLYPLIHLSKSPERAFLFDSDEYLIAARNLLSHGTLYTADLGAAPDPMHYSRRPPLYPVFVALSKLLSSDLRVLVTLQIIVVFASALLLLFTAKAMGYGFRTRLALTGAFLLYPAQIMYTGMIMSEIVFQFLLILSVYCITHFQISGKTRWLAVCNACLAAALLVKPVMLFFGPLLLAVNIYAAWKRKRPVLILMSLIFFITSGLWSYRNYLHTGYFHYSSIKSINLLHYNVKHAIGKKLGRDSTRALIDRIETEARSANDLKTELQSIEGQSTALILQNRAAYAGAHIRGAINVLLDPGRFDFCSFAGIEGKSLMDTMLVSGYKGVIGGFFGQPPALLVVLLIVLAANLLFAVSLLYFPFCPRSRSLSGALIMILFIYILALTGPVGASRFRLPLYPLLVLTLPPFLAALQRRLSHFLHSRE